MDIFVIIIAIILPFAIVTFIFALPAMLAVSPIPAHKKGIEQALKIAEIKKGENIYDLGCGDGRVLLRAVEKYDCFGIGYELVFPCYALARLKLLLAGKSEQVKIRYKNLFKADIENADVIFCFLSPELMQGLGSLIKKKKLKKGVRIVSYAFAIDHFEISKKINYSKENWNIYMYRL